MYFLRDMPYHMRAVTHDPLACYYSVQHVSVAIQRGNTAAVHGCMAWRVED